MRGANPGQSKKLGTNGNIKRYSGKVGSLPKGEDGAGGTKGGENLSKTCGYDKKGK